MTQVLTPVTPEAEAYAQERIDHYFYTIVECIHNPMADKYDKVMHLTKNLIIDGQLTEDEANDNVELLLRLIRQMRTVRFRHLYVTYNYSAILGNCNN